MEQKTYTTGEIAKICNVSVRTVQYYDRQKIISPTSIDINAKRIYSQKDLAKFQLVCLYKTLGFPLKEIKLIINSNQDYLLVLNLLEMQQEKIEQEISAKLEQKNKLIALRDEIANYKLISISNQNELTKLILKKKAHQKNTLLTVILTFTYGTLTIIALAVSTQLKEPYLAIIITLGLIVLLLGLINFHASNNAYICPHCFKKFTLSLLKDMFTLNNGKKGKYLKCPYCHQKNWMIETYKD